MVDARLALALVLLTSACQAAPATPTQTPVSPSPTQAAPAPTSTGTVPPQSPTPNATSTPKPPITPLPLQTPNPGGLDPRFGIAEGFRNPGVMADIGAGWERVVLSWADIQPDGPDDFSWLGRTLPPRVLAGELNRGVHMAGLLQFTARRRGVSPIESCASIFAPHSNNASAIETFPRRAARCSGPERFTASIAYRK